MASQSNWWQLQTIIFCALAVIFSGCQGERSNDSDEALVRSFLMTIASEDDKIEDVVENLDRFFRNELLTEVEYERYFFIRKRYVLVKSDHYRSLDDLPQSGEDGTANILLIPVNLEGERFLPYVRHDLRVSKQRSRFAVFPSVVDQVTNRVNAE